MEMAEELDLISVDVADIPGVSGKTQQLVEAHLKRDLTGICALSVVPASR